MEKHDQIKNELKSYLVYLQLMTSLMPKHKGGISDKKVRSGLVEVSEFLDTANKDDLLKKGPTLIKLLKTNAKDYENLFPPKLPIPQIAYEFDQLCLKNKEIYSYGLEYGWLQELMDCSNMGFPDGLPYHARIGLGWHAGFYSVEENFLLRDAFFLLILAEQSHKKMHAYAKHWKKSGGSDNSRIINEIFASANQNVAMYSRLCILVFFSYVEVFVNSVGYDFSTRNRNMLSPKDIEILHGRKNGHYLSLEYKIEKFPSIIRPDKKSPIVLSDKKKIKEPFGTFIREIKEIRDSSVHYSPQKKAAIWRKPDDWLDKAKSTSKICLEVSLAFWGACYPGRKEPTYLNGLNHSKHLDIARKKIRLQDRLNSNK